MYTNHLLDDTPSTSAASSPPAFEMPPEPYDTGPDSVQGAIAAEQTMEEDAQRLNDEPDRYEGAEEEEEEPAAIPASRERERGHMRWPISAR